MAGFLDMLIGVRQREGIVDVDRVDGWIQVIAEIQANGTDGRMVAQTQTRSMGEIIEAAISQRAD